MAIPRALTQFTPSGSLSVAEASLARRTAEARRWIAGYEGRRQWLLANTTEAAKILSEEAKVSLQVALLQIKLRTDLSHPLPTAEHVMSGFLELFPFRRRLHIVTQAVEEFPVPAFEKLADLFHDLVIVLTGLVAGAGCHTALNFKFDAGPVGPAVNVDVARGEREGLANDF